MRRVANVLEERSFSGNGSPLVLDLPLETDQDLHTEFSETILEVRRRR
ncbi:hypothetical protein [Lentzea sp. NBRC 102530]|nr:hypothetical protein [Lentzea sp. NBRC 102530]